MFEGQTLHQPSISSCRVYLFCGGGGNTATVFTGKDHLKTQIEALGIGLLTERARKEDPETRLIRYYDANARLEYPPLFA